MASGEPATELQKLDLAAFCNYVSTQYQHDKTMLSGATFALLAKKLLAAEVRPGGPYKNERGTETVCVNAAVGRLFKVMGTPLPQVEAFIHHANPSALTSEDRDALALYQKAARPDQRGAVRSLSEPYRLAHATLMKTRQPLRSQAVAFLERVVQADVTGEIANIASYAAQAIGVTVPQHTLNKLGEANIYGWIAYMIYDHIIDGETSPSLIPVANVAMRLSLDRYKEAIPHKHPLHCVIARLFDDIDEANAWELTTCRFAVSAGSIHIGALPDYKQHSILADRSGIHILGPLIVAQLSPFAQVEQKISDLTNGLRHYLIARQLSDDIHDWKKDIASGQISAVVAQLLARHGSLPKTHNIQELTRTLQQEFMRHTMETICSSITWHTQRASTLLTKAECGNGRLTGLVERIADMTKTSLAERARFLEFNKIYQNPASQQ